MVELSQPWAVRNFFCIFTVVFLTSATLLVFGDDIDAATNESPTLKAGDPLIQGEGHDHKDASQHEFGTDNMELLDFNPLTTPGNAEVQVATTPDGETYAYLAGWNDMHIVDVTDPTNTTVYGRVQRPEHAGAGRQVSRIQRP